ncbi:tagatose-bisphosphate aldolase [Lactobacillus amylovorus]|uniref:Tagatose 1,6-diphosphate aldolase n=1 Tax=Lactobacillus amylovorus TaxID=1604 RepID=A0A5B8EHM5_LACAM|nr:tagatose 1,6-diphosphate aldolase [Lactobacillus amylovorus]MDB6234487.1 tagatose 1,6-diphosphate aldolase [Lactobacillus amylovorus]MDB6268877.1 tagatose 1,6-diphosphate aldolase [Lactobacillus amylovorus]QDD70904.1 tagatose-bisphosphate aldolase [Lactobacillus amylovorus]
MRKISKDVAQHMEKLSNEDGVISALAIDQRGSLKKMLAQAANKPADETTIVDFKEAVSSELTPYASAILTDPEYGLPATKVRDKNCGLLLSYEKTGYDTTEPGRMCDLIPDQSALRIKKDGADAVKFLLYYDPDESDEINDKKKAFVERVGAETKANNLAFFLELLTYDGKMDSVKSEEYAKVKPNKVLRTMKEFSKSQYDVTVLKVEMPFNIEFVEGHNGGNNVVYTEREAKELLKKQSDITDLPYIFLSAGVTSEEFIDEINMAKEAGAEFNGVLCGRATWKPAVKPFAAEGEKQGRQWLAKDGKKNIENLNEALKGAKSWKGRLEVEE